MSLSVADAKKMLFTLRYPPDKILETYEGSFTATLSAGAPFSAFRTNVTIPHSFGTTVFTQLSYSLDGGTTWQDQHVTIPDETDPVLPDFQTCPVGCYSTTSNIVVVASNYTSGNKSVTYRLAAFSKE